MNHKQEVTDFYQFAAENARRQAEALKADPLEPLLNAARKVVKEFETYPKYGKELEAFSELQDVVNRIDLSR